MPLHHLQNVTRQIPSFNDNAHMATLALTNLGIPLTGSMSSGFAIGLMNGQDKKNVCKMLQSD